MQRLLMFNLLHHEQVKPVTVTESVAVHRKEQYLPAIQDNNSYQRK